MLPSTTSNADMSLEPSSLARTAFEVSNSVRELPPEDLVFAYDAARQAELSAARPWRADPEWFARVRVSVVALIKMSMHAKSGGELEVMGMMQGKVDAATRTLYVMDAFPLPVEGTETRVNAHAEAYEFMVQYSETSHAAQRPENVVGWYHSHPGYGCWLSGIDVATQELNQTFNEPWVAIVIDPKRTMSAGKVDIGAFRTLPQPANFNDASIPTASAAAPTATATARNTRRPAVRHEYQLIPVDKQADFGVHAERYYSLPIEIFKSSTDAAVLSRLWHKYWVATLADSPLVSNAPFYVGQVADLASRLQGVQRALMQQASFAAARDKEVDAGPVGQGDLRGGSWRLLALPPESTEDEGSPPPPGSGAGAGAGAGAERSESDQVHTVLLALRQHRDNPPLQQVARDARKVVADAQYGLVAQALKDQVFNSGRAGMQLSAPAPAPAPAP